jgi:hypothetical protein
MSGSSPALQYQSGPLADSEKADVRRFCGYPPYGAGPTGFQGWRFFQAYGAMEYRMQNMAPAEYQNIRMYLAQLYTLEGAVWGAGANLDTDKAAVWTHNKQEVRDRTNLFSQTRRELCALLGIPAGPQLGSPGMRLVV